MKLEIISPGTRSYLDRPVLLPAVFQVNKYLFSSIFEIWLKMMSGLNEFTCIERVTVSDIFARLCIERNLDNTTFKQKLRGNDQK